MASIFAEFCYFMVCMALICFLSIECVTSIYLCSYHALGFDYHILPTYSYTSVLLCKCNVLVLTLCNVLKVLKVLVKNFAWARSRKCTLNFIKYRRTLHHFPQRMLYCMNKALFVGSFPHDFRLIAYKNHALM